MKFIYLISVFFLVLSCSTVKKSTRENKPLLTENSCPEGGDCVFEVLKDSELKIKSDEFGKLYPEIIAGDHLVIKYQFKKKEVKNTVDGSYSEYVYFEINKKDQRLILRDSELQKVKMLYGRICFCRKAIGYFKVTDGTLFLFNDQNKLSMNLNFTVKKVPQKITEIKENINY